MPLYLTGVETAMSQVARILEQSSESTKKGVIEVINDIGARAAERAPVDTGNLRGSMGLALEQNGDEIIGEIGFHEKYAAAQHEHVEYKHPQGGEAKYLERAALEKADEVRNKMAEQLSQLFGGG